MNFGKWAFWGVTGAFTLFLGAIALWLIASNPIVQMALTSRVSTSQLRSQWSTEGMTSGEYKAFLKKGERIKFSSSVMKYISQESRPSYKNVIETLGPPDDVLDKKRVAQQYGDNSSHDLCIRYKLGLFRLNNQFMMQQICFKEGLATVSYGSGLNKDDPMANFDDTRQGVENLRDIR